MKKLYHALLHTIYDRRAKLVCFNMDGILLNSDVKTVKMMLKIIRTCNLKLEMTEGYERLYGKSIKAQMKELLGFTHVKDLPEKVEVAIKHAEKIHAGFYLKLAEPTPIISTILTELEDMDILTAICTNGHIEEDKSTLVSKLNMEMDYYIGNLDMNLPAKPDPEVFIYTMDLAEAKPSETIVIESTLDGYHAAIAAKIPFSHVIYYNPYDLNFIGHKNYAL